VSPRRGDDQGGVDVAELTEEQKTKLAEIDAKVESRTELSAEDIAFLEQNKEALDSIPAEEQETD
jgi:hypothetical protein